MKSCKHLEDVNGNEICAGEKEGGRDACQGKVCFLFLFDEFQINFEKKILKVILVARYSVKVQQIQMNIIWLAL